MKLLQRRRALQLAAAAAVIPAFPRLAAALDYPSHPIRMVVPFAAGGPTDALARMLAEQMKVQLGQPVIVENVTGAAGGTGVGRLVRAPADGTLSIGTTTTHFMIGALYALQFDLLKDLAPIAELAYEPLLIVARKSLPVSSLEGLIAWLKEVPPRDQQTPEGLAAFQKAEMDKWWPIIKAAGTKLE
jgi:tripartite-type tricarboxylate transporter receptor subunit TctC